MLVLKVLGMIWWLLVIPFGIGLLVAALTKKFRKNQEFQELPSMGAMLLGGYILMFALLELVGIPVMLFSVYHGFSNLYKIYAPLLILLAIAGIGFSVHWQIFQDIMAAQRFKYKESPFDRWEGWFFLFIFLLLVGVQLYMAFTRASFDGDDAYYGVQSLMAQQTDTLYRINPNNGRSTPLDARHALALFPIWEAFVGTMCGVHATIMAHSVVPLVLIPLSYLIYAEIAKIVFADRKALRPLFLVFMALWQMFGNVSIYTTETFFLTRTWQGKSFAGNFVLPAVLWLFLCLFYREKKEKPFVLWFLLGALNLAAGASSSLAVLLSCMLTVGVGFLFMWKERRVQNLLLAGGSCVLGGLYVLLYLAL